MANTDTHYLALYRKYRPQTFEDVVGRDAIVRTLKNQINTGHIGHSYLFCGTRGTGKTTIAKIFAKAVNCENPQDGSPCGKCASCKAISEDASLNVIELDAASHNGVEDVRGIIDQTAYSPTEGKYRVFIIDEAHMLSNAACNALLKTIEEPPSYAIFILATTDPNRLPVTILSRCQRYDFGRLSVQTIEDRLRYVCEKEQIGVEEKALRYIASMADGSMRDGLSILDECNAFNMGDGDLTYDKALEILGAVDQSIFHKLYGAVHEHRTKDALEILDEILYQGRELVQFVTDFISYLRNVMLLKSSEELRDRLDVSKQYLDLMIEDARASELTEIVRCIETLSDLCESIRFSANRRILTEAALIRLCEPSMQVAGNEKEQIEQLTERVRVLENDLARIAATGTLTAKAAAHPAAATPKAEASAKEEPEEAKTLPPATTEAIRKLTGPAWDQITAQIPARFNGVKALLHDVVPSVTDDGKKLLLVFSNPLCEDMFLQTGTKEEGAKGTVELLADYLSEKAGGQIQIECRHRDLDKEQENKENYVDIRKMVTLPVIEETDDE